MEQLPRYVQANRDLWNQRTAIHVQSEFYDLEGFLAGQSSLNPLELELLGEVQDKSILHLQCHFGQDTLSLARLGAHMTGVDLADHAIDKARELSRQLNLPAEFICCNLYDLPQYLDKPYDIVFTSYGVVGWLPDLQEWGRIISTFLKPAGKFILLEFHPVVWMFDDDFTRIQYPYFNREPIVETTEGTYADQTAPIRQECITWNHGLSDVFNGLLGNGLAISHFEEYDYSPYNCFRHAEQVGDRKYRIKTMGDKLPMLYSVVAEKK